MKRTVPLKPACFLESGFTLRIMGGTCVLPNVTEFEDQNRSRRRHCAHGKYHARTLRN